MRSQIGLIGLGITGQKLAKELDDKGIRVSLYQFPDSGLHSLMINLVLAEPLRAWRAGEDLVDFMVSLETPRQILITEDQEDLDDLMGQLIAIATIGDTIIKIGGMPPNFALHVAHAKKHNLNLVQASLFDVEERLSL
jgi:6-phosphogluconate dehydrogenase